MALVESEQIYLLLEVKNHKSRINALTSSFLLK